MRYWWVNHKQTAQQEIGNGYLWSPKREANGARSQFYDNMRATTPGDLVLSYANGIVGHVGVVTHEAISAPKPDELAVITYWQNEGWLVPVAWERMPVPIPPKNILTQISGLLPEKYSPLHPETGNGNQKAYLAEIGEPLFALIAGLGGFRSEQFGTSSDGSAVVDALEETIQRSIENDPGLSRTEKKELVLARRGQGLFRSRVERLESCCRLTRVETRLLLIASHIKPWRACANADERLDGENGLLLAPHVDRLFDRGFLTFEDEGKVLVSARIERLEIERLGLSRACASLCGSFSLGQRRYLSYHRENVFLP